MKMLLRKIWKLSWKTNFYHCDLFYLLLITGCQFYSKKEANMFTCSVPELLQASHRLLQLFEGFRGKRRFQNWKNSQRNIIISTYQFWVFSQFLPSFSCYHHLFPSLTQAPHYISSTDLFSLVLTRYSASPPAPHKALNPRLT